MWPYPVRCPRSWLGRKGLRTLIHVDPSRAMLDAAAASHEAGVAANPDRPRPRLHFVQGDEEHLPLAPGSVDVIVSCLGLHWVNDVPGAGGPEPHFRAARFVWPSRIARMCGRLGESVRQPLAGSSP